MTNEQAMATLDTCKLLIGVFMANPETYREAFDMGINALGKQLPLQPVPDENATGIDGKPVPRCQVCGYAMDLRMEQYCPCCGQRLTEYEVDE